MTLEEAVGEWEDRLAYIRKKCIRYDLPYVEPSDHYRAVSIYEILAGDCVSRELFLRLPNQQLDFWTEKFKEFRMVADPVLKKFLVQQINKLRGR